jgi:2-keto-3-deoxy-L-rhamnonate aldolase RhmA
MRENRVKRIVREGGLALGTYTGALASVALVELIASAGFDAAFVDLEHVALDLGQVQTLVLACERAGITPLVRTPGLDTAVAATPAPGPPARGRRAAGARCGVRKLWPSA